MKSRTLSLFTFTFHFHALEKEMATHSHVLAWRIPGTGEPGGLPSMGSHRVGHDWSDLAQPMKSQFHCSVQCSHTCTIHKNAHYLQWPLYRIDNIVGQQLLTLGKPACKIGALTGV